MAWFLHGILKTQKRTGSHELPWLLTKLVSRLWKFAQAWFPETLNQKPNVYTCNAENTPTMNIVILTRNLNGKYYAMSEISNFYQIIRNFSKLRLYWGSTIHPPYTVPHWHTTSTATTPHHVHGTAIEWVVFRTHWNLTDFQHDIEYFEENFMVIRNTGW